MTPKAIKKCMCVAAGVSVCTQGCMDARSDGQYEHMYGSINIKGDFE